MIGLLYVVGLVIAFGILLELKGLDEPWVMLAFGWPIVIPILLVAWITRQIVRRHRIAVAARTEAAQEAARLLREAGFEP